MTEDVALKYSVGALMYCPANHEGIIRVIMEGRIQPPYSVALCLEDAIADDAVEAAERQAVQTVTTLCLSAKTFYLPKLFIRVRSAAQILKLHTAFAESGGRVTGYILPKYAPDNADAYNAAIMQINQQSSQKIYMMPILESRDILNYFDRQKTLAIAKEKIDAMYPYVLNVRIGGNDFCNYYGLRRNVNQTIYDIGILRSVLTDIANVFLGDYVVSAPVWEYFDSGTDDRWRIGLRRELEMDRLNGLIGKTTIHPSQVEEINRSLRVLPEDYQDAQRILHWMQEASGVEKSIAGNRMNEVKTHRTWAEKIMLLAELYGVKTEDDL